VIRGIYRNGLFYPSEPVPPELTDGQEVRVEWGFDVPSDDPADIDQWDEQWRAIGPFHYESGERERVQAALEEADALAKASVRQQMESGR
jgi:predicted DNA-binding antitoxin AbrB/MazE fold protein